MLDPDSSPRRVSSYCLLAIALVPALLLAACGGKAISKTEIEAGPKEPTKESPSSEFAADISGWPWLLAPQ